MCTCGCIVASEWISMLTVITGNQQFVATLMKQQMAVWCLTPGCRRILNEAFGLLLKRNNLFLKKKTLQRQNDFVRFFSPSSRFQSHTTAVHLLSRCHSLINATSRLKNSRGSIYFFFLTFPIRIFELFERLFRNNNYCTCKPFSFSCGPSRTHPDTLVGC